MLKDFLKVLAKFMRRHGFQYVRTIFTEKCFTKKCLTMIIIFADTSCPLTFMIIKIILVDKPCGLRTLNTNWKPLFTTKFFVLQGKMSHHTNMVEMQVTQSTLCVSSVDCNDGIRSISILFLQNSSIVKVGYVFL